MSQPPPSPYGQPPYGRPPSGMSNKAKFWIGVAVSLPAMAAAGSLIAVGTALADGVGGSSDLANYVSAALTLALFAGFITAMVLERTRWIAIGMLAGAAIAFILAAGACVVLLAAVSNSYG